MIKIYSTNCPKCQVLKEKLKQKNIEFIEITDKALMIEMKLESVPMMTVNDGPLMNFREAVNYINKLEKNNG